MAKKNYAYINKDMLIWARGETPFSTTADVEAQQKGIKAEKLDLWESGEEFPSINEAKKLAALYKVPFACFFLSEPPEKVPKNYMDRRTYGGTVYREISYGLWKEIERVTQNRKIMLDYTDGQSNYQAIPSFDTHSSVKEIAQVMRDFLGLKPPYRTKSLYKTNAFNFFRSVLENKGIIVAQITDVSLEEMKGLSIYYETYPIIAVNNKDYERAKVFSLFHELAHIIRRSSSLCMIDFDDRNDDEEKLCDKIAAEILMPDFSFKAEAEAIRNEYYEWSTPCLRAIGDRFAVSPVAVVRRLFELKIISYPEYQTIYKRLSEEFEAKKLAEEIADNNSPIIKYHIRYLSKEGYLFPRTIVSAYYRGELSYGEFCRTLNMKSKYIDNIERAVML